MYKEISGGITAPKGFKANGVLAGIKAGRTKPDLALIVSDVPCNAGGIYTTNLVKGAPVTQTQLNLKNGKAQAVICNSGNANTCNSDGMEKAWRMCEIASEQLGIDPADVIVASTGVIGVKINMEPIEKAAKALAEGLSYEGSPKAAEAIMTTDTIPKEVAVELTLGGKTVKIGGISKGSGMIHPNMATMLCFVTTDCAISSELVRKAIKEAGDKTFNMISVDGDTSTNDTLTLMANGLAGNEEINSENADYENFLEALTYVCRKLSKLMAGDGEGATKLLIANVKGAKDLETAKVVSKEIICSSLVKAAMFGADANWGRILCAIGYSGADVDVNKIDVSFENHMGRIDVCKDGYGIDFSEEKGKEILTQKEINILVDLKSGEYEAEAYGCDLTYDYVRINGDYRT